MFKKEVIIGNFIKKNKVLSYLEYIHNIFNVKYSNLFVYTIENNDNEYIVTFKVNAADKTITKEIKGSHVLHYKRSCLFSINALNKIKNEEDDSIDWDLFSNKLVLLNNDILSVKMISKVEDKAELFI